jgi:hypothetical protein
MRADEELRRIYRLGGLVGILAGQAATAGAAAAYGHAVRLLGADAAVAIGSGGLLPDLLSRWRAEGVDVGPLLRSAEGYISMWRRLERAAPHIDRP